MDQKKVLRTGQRDPPRDRNTDGDAGVLTTRLWLATDCGLSLCFKTVLNGIGFQGK